MAKRRNVIPSESLKVTTTPQVRELLNRLVETGLYGKNVPEAAGRLIERALEDRVNTGQLEPPKTLRRGARSRRE